MTITMEQLARLLDGREYGSEIAPDEEAAAKEAGLVIIFGASDDLVELHGAIDDEVDAYGGTAFSIDREGVIPRERDDRWAMSEMQNWFRRVARVDNILIVADWCPDDDPGRPPWVIRASGVSWSGFGIVEDSAPFCRGIVVQLPGGDE